MTVFIFLILLSIHFVFSCVPSLHVHSVYLVCNLSCLPTLSCLFRGWESVQLNLTKFGEQSHQHPGVERILINVMTFQCLGSGFLFGIVLFYILGISTRGWLYLQS